MGFERPTRKYSRPGRVRGGALPRLLIFSLVALPPGYRFAPPCGARRNLRALCRSISSTATEIAPHLLLPPAATGRNSQRASLVGLYPKPKGASLGFATKKEHRPNGLCSFLVAGVGFEPHGLRVMSPTSYQAALPRDMNFLLNRLVPVTGVEPVRYFRITGF